MRAQGDLPTARLVRGLPLINSYHGRPGYSTLRNSSNGAVYQRWQASYTLQLPISQAAPQGNLSIVQLHRTAGRPAFMDA